MDGLLLIDKPAGLTSHDVVEALRRRLKIRRVGHGGTLDPAATGLLILLVGQATRKAHLLLEADKTYRSILRLGIRTDTQDREGRVLETRPVPPLTLEQIEQACRGFLGEIRQRIPAYSAVRIQGRRSYELARAGLPVPERTRVIKIHEIRVLGFRPPEVDLEVTCSKGTYLRMLCEDLGQALGTVGHLGALRRTRVGPFHVDQALPLDQAGPEHLIPKWSS